MHLWRALEGTQFAIANFHGQGDGLFPVGEVEIIPIAGGHRRQRVRAARMRGMRLR